MARRKTVAKKTEEKPKVVDLLRLEQRVEELEKRVSALEKRSKKGSRK